MSQSTFPIALNQISKAYGEKAVLSGVSVSFQTRTTNVILGRSGSGKSTLLQIINGLIQPDQGNVLLFDEPVDYKKMQAIRLQMGYVIQQVGLFPHMDVQSNISLLGRISHQSKEAMHARVLKLLDMVQLPQAVCKKYPHELSGGEQQRVGLCRAMFLNPPILLMDEPFGSLDYETKRIIYQHLLTIQGNEPRTVVLVTHDWDEAITLADQFIWIEKGEIKASGDKRALKELKISSAL